MSLWNDDPDYEPPAKYTSTSWFGILMCIGLAAFIAFMLLAAIVDRAKADTSPQLPTVTYQIEAVVHDGPDIIEVRVYNPEPDSESFTFATKEACEAHTLTPPFKAHVQILARMLATIPAVQAHPKATFAIVCMPLKPKGESL